MQHIQLHNVTSTESAVPHSTVYTHTKHLQRHFQRMAATHVHLRSWQNDGKGQGCKLHLNYWAQIIIPAIHFIPEKTSPCCHAMQQSHKPIMHLSCYFIHAQSQPMAASPEGQTIAVIGWWKEPFFKPDPWSNAYHNRRWLLHCTALYEGVNNCFTSIQRTTGTSLKEPKL